MNEKKNFDYKKLRPFKWYILENFPFLEDSIDVLTNYQLFCKLGEMYNKEIDAINTLGIQVEGLTDWFDDLDVQEEIDNKLDEMAESGELEEIIASYLNTKAIICFDTVSDMKQAENLVDGSYAKTLGYHEKNDGGSATYKIRNITNEDVVDEMLIVALNDNTLIGELIYEMPLNPLQLGAYGDGVHDDIIPLQKSIDLGSIDLKGKNYYISDILEINNDNRSINGNDGTIISDGNYAISCEGSGIEDPRQRISIENLHINLSNEKNGLYFKDTYFLYLNKINVNEMDGNNAIGINIINGFNQTITNSRVLGNNTKTGQIGLNIESTNNGNSIENMTNCEYKNILLQRLSYGVKCNYRTASNVVVFDDLGFSSNTYAFYLQGTSRPIVIKNSRIEVGTLATDTYGFYIDNNIQISIDTFNVYNIKYPIYNISGNDITLDGQMAFTGSTQSTKYNAITSNGNVNFGCRPYYLSNVYNLYNSSTMTSGASVVCGFGFIPHPTSTINSDTFTVVSPGNYIYKLENRVFNLYGTKGTEILVYADTEGYKIQSSTNGSTTSQFTGSNIDVEVNKFYKIKFLDNNKWTVYV